jgi:arginyl-tRNA synthetase
MRILYIKYRVFVGFEVLERAAVQYEPHLLINYLRELAAEFHSYYNAHQFIVDDAALRNARLNLKELQLGCQLVSP